MKLISAEQHAKILYRFHVALSAIGAVIVVTSLIFVTSPVYFSQLAQVIVQA